MKSSSAKDKSLDNLLSQFAFKKSPKKGQITPLKPPLPTQKNTNNNSKDKTRSREFPEELQCFVLSKKVKMSDLPKNSKKDSSIKVNLPPKEKVAPEPGHFDNPLDQEPFDMQIEEEEADETSSQEEEDIDLNMKNKNVKKSLPKRKRREKKDKKPNKYPSRVKLGVEYEKKQTTLETIKLPEWAKEPNLRDKNGKRPGEENYDSTSLFIPPNALDKMSIFMKTYWEVKRNHYDKLVLIRVHRAYLLHYTDAYVYHTECDSNIFQGFGYAVAYMYPAAVNKHCQKLLEKNYKIVLVEPTKFYEDKKDAAFEMYQIITKGTFIEPNLNNSALTSRYCLVLTDNQDLQCGFTYMDTTTHEFFMGEFQDTPNRTQLRSLLFRTTPVEIVYREKTLSKDTVNMIKNMYWKPIVTSLPSSQPIGIESILYRINKYIKRIDGELNTNIEILRNLVIMAEESASTESSNCPNYWILQGIYFAIEYLEYLYLTDIIFQKCVFFLDYGNQNSQNNPKMILDGQSVHHLELLDVPYLGTNQNGALSLFKYMDKTKSVFGKRMLKKWLLEPLMDPVQINERLDAIEELAHFDDISDFFQLKVSRLHDLERLIHNIYNYGNRRIFYLNDVDAFVKPKVNIFIEALQQLREADNIMKFMSEYAPKIRTKRLSKLLNYQTESGPGGLFPKITDLLDKLEGMIITRKDIPLPIPAPGKDRAFDKLMEEVDVIKHKLQIILEETRKKLKCESIVYVHIKKRYEMEIPSHLVEGSKKPKELISTSKRQGYVRFQTTEIQNLLEELKEVEFRMQDVIVPFIVKCFKEFYAFHTQWRQVILCLGELDCLISLTKLAKTMPLSCRPQFITPDTETTHQIFELRGAIHPCIAARFSEFVKNDVILEQDKNVFLITGPNMGGKSTLMRTVCIATIMAQVGSYVPAESFILTPRDRVFTRIGANDNIFEGKSTFFVELEETLNIVNEATENSLVIIDELGRGTSTYDGMAIAYAVLKHLTENVKCMTMFATHFHMLLEEFRLFKSVEMYYMESEFVEDEILEFLYNFKKGCISNSFGLSVARMAGLPEQVIKKGREKASHLTEELACIHENLETQRKFIECMKLLEEELQQG